MRILLGEDRHLGLEGLDGLGGDPELDKAVSLGPEDALPLEVHLLHLVGADVRERDRHGVVGALPQEHALLAAGHLESPGGRGARHLRHE